MKKIILLSICLLAGSYASAQDTTISRYAIFTTPKKVQKLNKQQYLEYGKQNFNKPYAALPNDHVYLIDGLLVTIRDREIRQKRRKTLEDLKKEMESISSMSNIPYTRSSIVTINNRRVYIYEFYLKDEGHLSFYTNYVGSNNSNIVGVIDFKRPDEAKAHKHLDDLLKNIRYTDDSIN